jgi:hypothetical protein
MSARDRDRLDQAIDQVARAMVDVRDEGDFAQRIAGALPERPGSGAWWLMPQLAALGLTAVAAVLMWWPRSDSPARAVLPATAVTMLARLPEAVRASEPGTSARTFVRTPVRTPVRTFVRTPVELPDHERSLPAVAGPEAIAFADLTPWALPVIESLTLPSIAPAELPLTSELFLTVKQE